MDKLINSTQQHIQKILDKDYLDQEDSVTLINLTIVLRNLREYERIQLTQ